MLTPRDAVVPRGNLSNLEDMKDPAEEERDERAGSGSSPAVWTGRATNRVQWLLACGGAACLALGIVIAVESMWTSGIAALLMSVVGCIAAGLLILFGTLAFVHVAVKVDDDCLEVRCGHLGLPRRHIPLSHVVGADFAPAVTPRQWGGWGYRWRPEKGTAVVVRRGEALVLSLGDGHKFTVTVDDAESAVRAIRQRLRLRGTAL
ncbi:Lipoprotein OS=Streptomyces alboniger OX=132473 GN=CP975_03950 PE=4 SV=1 [Streptomyces alboniger]